MSDIARHILSLFSLNQSPANPTTATPPAVGTAQPQAESRPDLPPSPKLVAELAALRARAADILTVFDDPRCAPLDVPDWVPRVSPLAHHDRLTVRGLVRAMREAAADAGLVDGERYVLAAVCACAEGADSLEVDTNVDVGASHPPDPQGDGDAKAEALARRLQHLASVWVAFLLWPFYARMEDPESWAQGDASPCTGLSHARKVMAFGDFDPDECIPMSSYPLRDQVLGRDGHRCVVSGVWDVRSSQTAWAPLGAKQGYVEAVRIFKHPLVVYKDVYDSDRVKRKSVLLSLEVLRRYCQPDDDRHIAIEPPGSGGVMDDPANLLSLCLNAHLKFDIFALSFVHTQCANTYTIADRDPQPPGVPHPHASTVAPARAVAFQDLSAATDRAPEQHAVSVPDRGLLRMHAALGSVLYATGAASMFDRIEASRERPGVHAFELPAVPGPDGASFWREVVANGSKDDRDRDRSDGVDPRSPPDLGSFARVLRVVAPRRV